jgi:hypothetical protein
MFAEEFNEIVPNSILDGSNVVTPYDEHPDEIQSDETISFVRIYQYTNPKGDFTPRK